MAVVTVPLTEKVLLLGFCLMWVPTVINKKRKHGRLQGKGGLLHDLSQHEEDSFPLLNQNQKALTEDVSVCTL